MQQKLKQMISIEAEMLKTGTITATSVVHLFRALKNNNNNYNNND